MIVDEKEIVLLLFQPIRVIEIIVYYIIEYFNNIIDLVISK